MHYVDGCSSGLDERGLEFHGVNVARRQVDGAIDMLGFRLDEDAPLAPLGLIEERPNPHAHCEANDTMVSKRIPRLYEQLHARTDHVCLPRPRY